ncbi:cyclin-dependent kinase with F-box domain [Achlya hypogyna]|uniref:Cyclin-F n=1 Tax=Achlya hypogyna TaxID=1202772 RepID=A0A1V9YAS9_ACHHY|nr:cyclin-dependent kinase with F-box domain [Achlya hypogyna]
MDVARLLSGEKDGEDEEMLLSIDPSERVEHRSTKLVRREIVIASPVSNEDMEDVDEAKPAPSTLPSRPEALRLGFDLQPVDMILHVFSFLIDTEDLHNMQLVSKRWRELTSHTSLYRHVPDTTPEGTINWLNFRNLGIKNKGTEGTCYRCYQRSSGKVLAMKRARVFPKGEGVPYYMLRELAVLRGISHPHIASLEMISLAKDELHVFFPYVDKTLHEIINPTSDPNGGRVLPEHQIRRLLHQLLDAIAYCHRRGVLHRNLKPKHLLIDTAVPDNYDEATLRISDFALVRATGIPRRQYTMEVVTLWYRPPEILMGEKQYSPAVDVWSVGCIFAEMAQGKPLFTGISEIDQLFQIFSKLSTPTAATWPAFTSLPNYRFEFPNWKPRPLERLFPHISPLGLDLLGKLLTYNPDTRISAENALRHPYFDEHASLPRLLPSIPMTSMAFGLRRAVEGEYLDLFHAHLRDAELQLCKEVKYLSRQKTLRPLHRSMLVDWLIEGACGALQLAVTRDVVVDVFEMCLRTAFLAVNYTDRFLDVVMVKKTKFQLLGATCLHVASKCEDVSYIGVEDLSMCADNVYNSMEVLKMEEQLLNTLNFTLAVPTALDFLNIYQKCMPELEQKTSMLAHYLSELALQEYSFLKYLPSCVATCCLSLALYCCHGYAMTPELKAACRYSWEDLKECMTTLQEVYSSSQFNVLTVVKKRYSEEDRCQRCTSYSYLEMSSEQLAWKAAPVAGSIATLLLASHTALHLLDRSRYFKSTAVKRVFFGIATLALGVAGVLSFHVSQASASSALACDGFLLLQPEWLLAAFGLGVAGSMVSLYVATQDPFFAGLGETVTLSSLLNKRKTELQIQFLAKFSQLQPITGGAFVWSATLMGVRLLLVQTQMGLVTESPWWVLVWASGSTFFLGWLSFWGVFRLITFRPHVYRFRWYATLLFSMTIALPHYLMVALSTHQVGEVSNIAGVSAPAFASNLHIVSLLLLVSILLGLTHFESHALFDDSNPHAILPAGLPLPSSKAIVTLQSSTHSFRFGSMRSLVAGRQRSSRIVSFK